MEQLLTTKLFIPPTRPELVPRPRLIDRLNEGLHRKLTLISAPAGFGKTTLVSEWVNGIPVDGENERQIDYRIAWLSLDEGDNDPARFLTYFITSLNQIEGTDAAFGIGALSMLQSPQPPPPETTLTSLINEIAAIPDKIIFIFDDYHLIEAQPIHDALSFLLEHLPHQLHLVIATREDPHLPLSRLRARGQLTEIRAKDLRFTSSEAAEFLNQVMGLDLLSEDIAALETRTEGWIAGLQLAAISLQGNADTHRLIQSFSGSHRLVLDYLIEEVLDQQPESVQIFLLKTAILDRLTGSLCDALTDQEEGQTTLEMLERANLFIIPLDGERQWYRYHHLFADLLRQRLRQIHLEQISTLHSRASEWYEQNGLRSDAIHQALAAKDFDRAAGLVELAWQDMDSSFQTAAWLGWVKKLPDELIRNRPVLSTQYAWALWMDGELEASEIQLRDAERWLDPEGDRSARLEGSADVMVVVDEEQFRTLAARIALARANNAQALGDIPGTVKYAELALKLTPEEDHVERAQATVTLGFSYWASGDLEDTLVFREDETGDIEFAFVPLQNAALEKLAWYEGGDAQLRSLGMFFFIFLSPFIVWPLGALIRRIRKQTSTATTGSKRARWVAGLMSALNFIFMIILLLSMGDLSLGVPLIIQIALIIPLVTALLTLIMVVMTIQVWLKGYWSFWGRIYYSLLTLTAMLFLVWANYWNLLGWRF